MPDIQRALDLIRNGRIDDALDALDGLVRRAETRADALGHRAWLHRNTGRYQAAIKDYEALLADSPESPEILALLAEARFLAGEFHEAMALAARSLSRNPLEPRAALVISKAQRLARGEAPDAEPDVEGGREPAGLNRVIEQLESDGAHFRASVSPRVARLLHALVRVLAPVTVVETGTFIGYSTLAIAQALHDNGKGHLDTFDLFAPLDDVTSPVAGPVEDTLAMVERHLAEANLSERVTCHKGISFENLGLVLRHRSSVDFAFIDGDHRIRGCLNDWRVIDEHLAEGGIVALHDTFPAECAWVGPRMLIDRLSRPGSGYQAINLPTHDRLGVALLQKLGSGKASPVRFNLLHHCLEKLAARL